jgi:hypothetical protein
MASGLAKRILGDDTPSTSSREDTPPKAEEVRLAPVSKIIATASHHKHRTRKRRNGLIFLLGGLFGILVAGYFAERNDLFDFPEFGDLSMDSLMDALPAGFLKDARDLQVSLFLGNEACQGINADLGGEIERREGSGELRFFFCGVEPSGARDPGQPSSNNDPRRYIDRLGILGNDE